MANVGTSRSFSEYVRPRYVHSCVSIAPSAYTVCIAKERAQPTARQQRDLST